MRDRAAAQSLGKRVRSRRQASGLTLREVESRSGVSATHISEVERGKTSPTVGVLERISHALGVRPGELLDRPAVLTPLIMTPDERRKRFFSGGAVVEGLTQIHGPCDFSMCWVELPAGAQFLSEGAHPGEELCHVIVGGVEVRLGDATYLLQPNDTLHFRPSAPHAIVNATNTPARLIWVSRPRAAL